MQATVTVVQCLPLETKSSLSPTVQARAAGTFSWSDAQDEQDQTRGVSEGGECGSLRSFSVAAKRKVEEDRGEDREREEVVLLHMMEFHFDRLAKRAEVPPSKAMLLRKSWPAWTEDADLLDRLIADLENLEVQTRSAWNEFKRLMSLGGSEPAPEADDIKALKDLRSRFYHEGIADSFDLSDVLHNEVRDRLFRVQVCVQVVRGYDGGPLLYWRGRMMLP